MEGVGTIWTRALLSRTLLLSPSTIHSSPLSHQLELSFTYKKQKGMPEEPGILALHQVLATGFRRFGDS